MTPIERILVCILPDLKTDLLKRYTLNSAAFAKQIGADIHFLTHPDAVADLNSALQGLPAHEFQAIHTVFHSIAKDWPSGAVADAVQLYSCDLIILPIGSAPRDSSDELTIRKHLLEHSRSPILLISPKVDLRQTPIGSVLVPMSGEIRVSSALKFGLHLVGRIHVPVDLLHVLEENAQARASLETLGDQPHHEFGHLLDQVLAEACPFSNAKDRTHVRTLFHVKGNPIDEILKAAGRDPGCALIIEWHASLTQGRAETLKSILYQIFIPIFLVRAESEQKSTLKIGPERRIA